MKNIKFYNIAFWFSRIFTVFMLLFLFIVVLNAKYMFFEKLYLFLLNITGKFAYFIMGILGSENIKYFIKFSLYVTPDAYARQGAYEMFCINSQIIDILIIVSAIIFIISFITKMLYKTEDKNIFYNNIIIFAVYIISFFITNLKIFLILCLICPLFYMLIQLINRKFSFSKYFLLIPVISDILSVKQIAKYIFPGGKKISLIILIISLICSNIFAFFVPCINSENNMYSDIRTTYICKDTVRDRIAISSRKGIFLTDKNNIEKKEIGFNFETFVYNKNKDEYYMFNKANGTFYVLNGKDLSLINSKKLIDRKENSFICEPRFALNNGDNMVIVVFEDTFSEFLISTDNLEIIKTFEIFKDVHPPTDSVCYNKFRKSFLISSWQMIPIIQEISLFKEKTNLIDCQECQGFICVSNKNKEIYVALHQLGKIYVYDAETMDFKRSVKAGYTVKDISYDEELNIIIAPEYFTGKVKIFLMDGTDTLLYDEYIGRRLGMGMFDPGYEFLYVTSQFGLYRTKVNIKELIAKSKL